MKNIMEFEVLYLFHSSSASLVIAIIIVNIKIVWPKFLKIVANSLFDSILIILKN